MGLRYTGIVAEKKRIARLADHLEKAVKFTAVWFGCSLSCPFLRMQMSLDLVNVPSDKVTPPRARGIGMAD